MSIAAVETSAAQYGRPWLPQVTGLAVLLAAIGVLFRKPIADAVSDWWIYPAYSHGFLIVPITLWLVWEKRQVLARAVPSVTLAPLWAFPAVLALWALGELAAINEARQLAVVGFFQLAIWSMIGTSLYRFLLFPALYLFFLVPMGEYLIEPLQRLTTQMADFGLTLLAIPHFTEGTTIELTNGRFEIAEACAGLRFLTATLALGALYAYLSFRRWYKILLFLLACVVVPILSNGLRVLGIILLAHATDNRLGVGADHIVYGWGLNVAIVLAMLFIGSLFRDHREAEITPTLSGRANSLLAVATTVVVLLVAIGIGPAIASWRESRALEPNVARLTRPLELGGLRVSNVNGRWHPTYIGADAEVAADVAGTSPSDGGTPVTLYVEYYARARPGHSLITHLNREWDVMEWHAVNTSLAATEFANFRETTIVSTADTRLLWSTYWAGGRFTPSPFLVKLLQVAGALTGNEGQAVLALSTPIDSTPEQARARLMATVRHLGDLRSRLEEADRGSRSPR